VPSPPRRRKRPAVRFPDSSPGEAGARAAALSDAEVAGLAGRIDALPAGGIAGVLPLIVVAVLFYYLIVIPDTTPKPAAEKK